MGLRTRNVQKILNEEANLFSRIGMEKVGYEGFIPTLINGGDVWYIARYKDTPNEYYTIRFNSWFGHIRLITQRWLNPKIIN